VFPGFPENIPVFLSLYRESLKACKQWWAKVGKYADMAVSEEKEKSSTRCNY